MKKWQKKIYRRAQYYDDGWDKHVAEQHGQPLMCERAYRYVGFADGAEWMLGAIVHMLRQKKYKCDKLRREGKTEADKTVPTFAASLYSRIIKDLTE